LVDEKSRTDYEWIEDHLKLIGHGTIIKLWMTHLVETLNAIRVSSVSLASEFRSCQGVDAIGYDDDVEKDMQNLFRVGRKRLFSNFSTSIPFLNELVLLDLVGSWDGSTCHLASKQGTEAKCETL
jgi:hypothetical protein